MPRPRGEPKLTDEQCRAIAETCAMRRSLLDVVNAAFPPQSELARRNGVTPSTISKIAHDVRLYRKRKRST